MTESTDILQNLVVVFSIDEQCYALPLNSVISVERIVEITHIPDKADYVRGVINVHGTIMLVVDFRRRMHLRERPEILSDQLMIIHCHGRPCALMVDGAIGVSDINNHDITQIEELLTEKGLLTGIGKTSEGMILLNNPDELLVDDDLDKIEASLMPVTL